jgi:uncharacterized protein (DUF2236 family)
VIARVTRLHARVEGATPAGEPYRALDPDLLRWVHATAAWGFLHAYERFVAPLGEADRRRFYAEGAPVARLYGVPDPVRSDAEFEALAASLLPRFQPHPIIDEFLAIIEAGRAAPALPPALHRALARASVSLLPAPARERLGLGVRRELSGVERAMLRSAGALADRLPDPFGPPAQACRRLGLPWDFLYRSARSRARVLRRLQMPLAVAD